jgi:hypothetical protein
MGGVMRNQDPPSSQTDGTKERLSMRGVEMGPAVVPNGRDQGAAINAVVGISWFLDMVL